jgi:hypothetical protein
MARAEIPHWCVSGGASRARAGAPHADGCTGRQIAKTKPWQLGIDDEFRPAHLMLDKSRYKKLDQAWRAAAAAAAGGEGKRGKRNCVGHTPVLDAAHERRRLRGVRPHHRRHGADGPPLQVAHCDRRRSREDGVGPRAHASGAGQAGHADCRGQAEAVRRMGAHAFASRLCGGH